MKAKEKLGVRIKRAFDAEEVLGAPDDIEIRGRGDLTVHGCVRILHYGEELIRLSLTEYILSVHGEELYCASFYRGAVRIVGRIDSLEFEDRRKK